MQKIKLCLKKLAYNRLEFSLENKFRLTPGGFDFRSVFSMLGGCCCCWNEGCILFWTLMSSCFCFSFIKLSKYGWSNSCSHEYLLLGSIAIQHLKTKRNDVLESLFLKFHYFRLSRIFTFIKSNAFSETYGNLFSNGSYCRKF